MTIRDFYNYAVQHGILDDDLLIKAKDEGVVMVTNEMISPSYKDNNTVINLGSIKRKIRESYTLTVKMRKTDAIETPLFTGKTDIYNVDTVFTDPEKMFIAMAGIRYAVKNNLIYTCRYDEPLGYFIECFCKYYGFDDSIFLGDEEVNKGYGFIGVNDCSVVKYVTYTNGIEISTVRMFQRKDIEEKVNKICDRIMEEFKRLKKTNACILDYQDEIGYLCGEN